jgi:hypothetical protein
MSFLLYLFLLNFFAAASFQIYEMMHTGENLPSVKYLLNFQAYKRFKSGRRTGKSFHTLGELFTKGDYEVQGASKIKLKKVNKKRGVTVRRVIIFLNISRHPLLT